MHEIANPQVIYRDFKTSNILLDQDFNPKLSDFGLAKVSPSGDNSHVFTSVIGTYGYCAPEYIQIGQLSTKSDVYSFGVMFLELITGRRAVDNSRPPRERNLVSWVSIECFNLQVRIFVLLSRVLTRLTSIVSCFMQAKPLLNHRKKFVLLADPLLDGAYPIKGLHHALTVAAMCLQEEPSLRPLMSYVVRALECLITSNEPEEGKKLKHSHHENLTLSNGGRI